MLNDAEACSTIVEEANTKGLQNHRCVILWSFRVAFNCILQFSKKHSNELGKGVVNHAWEVLHQCNYNLHSDDAVKFVHTI